jgi:hypothetical protein
VIHHHVDGEVEHVRERQEVVHHHVDGEVKHVEDV